MKKKKKENQNHSEKQDVTPIRLTFDISNLNHVLCAFYLVPTKCCQLTGPFMNGRVLFYGWQSVDINYVGNAG